MHTYIHTYIHTYAYAYIYKFGFIQKIHKFITYITLHNHTYNVRNETEIKVNMFTYYIALLLFVL